MLFYNARIFGNEDYEYLLIKGNKIEKLGKGNLPSETRKIDLKGALILPAFCDSHTHLSNIALMHGTLDLTNKGREEIFDMVREECKKKEMVIGRGWDESFWKDKKYLTKEEIDNVCKDKIVLLIREDGHMGVINSYVSQIFSLEEDGIVKEKELEKITKKLKIGATFDFEYAQNYALSKGIACVHDFASVDTLKAYMRMHRDGKLKIRIYANFYSSGYKLIKKLGLYSGFGDDYLRIGALKLFADGSIGAKTAATRYRDGEEVNPMLSSRKIRRIMGDVNSAGIRVFTHAIGDYAIEEVLKGYEGSKGNRIEHFELVREEYLDNLEGVNLSMQPNFLKWAKRGGLYDRMLGQEWLSKNNTYRNILDSNANLLFGSDCMPMDPLYGIKMAVNSEYESQRIRWEEAVRAYTLGAKYFGKKYGEIKGGNIADLVVLKDDKIWMTIVDGKIMYTSQ